MNIHEYQAKAVLRAFSVPVALGFPALTLDEAAEGAKKLGGPLWVVKSQIHAGGRGKGRFKEASAGDKGGSPGRSRKSRRSPRRCWARPL